MPTSRPVVTLIDASGFIFRAYHAIANLSTSKGVPTNALYGFTRMLLKTLRDFAPTHVALAFDLDSRQGRLAIDPEYKATRVAPPEDLLPQFDLVRRVVRALNLPILEARGWEADDVIGTVVQRAREEGFAAHIITGDKDFVQLVGDDVTLFDPMHDRRTTVAEVRERLGILPTQMCDYLALVGDASDNVPKVPGVGPKTAGELIAKFGSVEALLARASEIEKPKLREAVLGHAESIQRAKKLVTFKMDLPLGVTMSDLVRRPIHHEETRALFTEFEFFRLLADLPPTPASPQVDTPWEALGTTEALDAFVASARDSGRVAVIPAFEGLPHQAVLLGIGVALPNGRSAFMPWERTSLMSAPVDVAQMRVKAAAILADAGIQKIVHDHKALLRLLEASRTELAGEVVDVEMLSYLLNPSRREHALADLAQERLGVALPAPTGGPRSRLADRSIEELGPVFSARANAALKMVEALSREVEESGLGKLWREVERPLIPVLAKMERAGIKLDVQAIARVSARVDTEAAAHLTAIHQAAGHEFNVASNAQLGKVLFEELKLPVLRKGKTGPSADQEVLEKLGQHHPIARSILEYRGLTKLKSTYLDTLLPLLGPDQRLHTTFHPAATATGRLSSSDPNLQNIPIRTELGREIRRAFVAEDGFALLSADYSQIELRILAHFAGDAALLEAFAKDEDIHRRTAAEVFGVTQQGVSDQQRRIAKMVNFGIAYGLSAHGLSTRLDIPMDEAKGIIDRYFERYSGMRRYLDETVATARERGFVETLWGRRRWMNDLRAGNRQVVQAAERAAINMPIQGTAADIIKVAMLRVAAALAERKLEARMLLQVHDELVFEVPKSEVAEITQLVREHMSGVVTLAVPLKVEIGSGPTWADTH
ncbi:MAG: DNA polymerase I [Myxococcaceae bacterium]